MLQGQSKTDADMEEQGKGTSYRIIKCQVKKKKPSITRMQVLHITSHTHTLNTKDICMWQMYETNTF